jgi:nicotinamidase/pyrazinamidase
LKPSIIIVDMLEDNIMPFSLEIVPAINRLTRWARRHSIPVVFAMDSFLPGDFIFGGKMKEHCIRDTHGARVMGQLEQDDQDIYLPKRRFSAFFKTDLDQTLRLYNLDTVAIAGINTHWCVLNTAFDALANDFRTYILTDCCTSNHVECHESTLKTYQRNALYPLFQFIESDTFITEYEKGSIRSTTS